MPLTALATASWSASARRGLAVARSAAQTAPRAFRPGVTGGRPSPGFAGPETQCGASRALVLQHHRAPVARQVPHRVASDAACWSYRLSYGTSGAACTTQALEQVPRPTPSGGRGCLTDLGRGFALQGLDPPLVGRTPARARGRCPRGGGCPSAGPRGLSPVGAGRSSNRPGGLPPPESWCYWPSSFSRSPAMARPEVCELNDSSRMFGLRAAMAAYCLSVASCSGPCPTMATTE